MGSQIVGELTTASFLVYRGKSNLIRLRMEVSNEKSDDYLRGYLHTQRDEGGV